MATVWRGRDLRLDRPVAIKQISGLGLSQPFALERFTREARAVGRLSHPNVVAVHDFGTQDDEPYLVLELVEGPTVAKVLLAAGRLPIVDVLSIASQVCDGLAAAHAAGIIHRDIKPANLILAPHGVVKICDFGVARLLDTSPTPNLTGPIAAMGSPSYMAPEQISGGAIGPRTDLYALGGTMYAMLTGRPPFTGGGQLGVVQQHLVEPPVPLTQRRPDVPATVEELVADLLAKNPDERPPDAATVQARIESALHDPATVRLVRRRGSTGAARRPRPDRRLWLTTALVAIAVLLTLIAVNVFPALQWAGRPATARWIEPTSTPSVAAVAPAPTASTVAPSPTASRPSPSASPTPTATTTPSPVDPIVALRQVIAQEVNTGDLRPDAATDLNHAVDALAKTVATGRAPDITKQITVVRGKLTTYNKEGKLTDGGYTTLTAAVDQVAATP
jgi:serine/threonine-protein kinase